MDIQLSKLPGPADLIILPLFQDDRPQIALKQKTKLELPEVAARDFINDVGTTQLVYLADNRRILLLGLGDRKNFRAEIWRIALHSAVRVTLIFKLPTAAIFLPSLQSKHLPHYLELTGFGLVFSNYQFDEYKKDRVAAKLETVRVIAAVSKANEKALAQGVAIGRAANAARSLANHPGNTATPSHLAEQAVKLARVHKFSCKILGPKEIDKAGLGLLRGVARGSDEPARFIVLEYGNKKTAPIVLIGKGLTFDSGGISIKPADRMEEMKYDMCGAATVLGVFEAVAELKLPVHLVGLIPSTENLVSGSAVKPGDILIAHDQTSVEIINTDAEGRLVLADALSFAQTHYQPRLMIDYATLTGAVLVALGDQYTGYFTNTKSFDAALTQASQATAEQFWKLPLAPEYRDQLKSLHADIKNIGEKGSAGATTAALFLEYFVKERRPWIHFDIAGTAWTMRPKPYASPGATAWGVYLTIEFLRQLHD